MTPSTASGKETKICYGQDDVHKLAEFKIRCDQEWYDKQSLQAAYNDLKQTSENKPFFANESVFYGSIILSLTAGYFAGRGVR